MYHYVNGQKVRPNNNQGQTVKEYYVNEDKPLNYLNIISGIIIIALLIWFIYSIYNKENKY